MKKFIRSFSALTLCVLCLISMIAPTWAIETAECTHPDGHLYGAILHNDWYHYKVYSRDANSYCYRIYNARCEAYCVYCNNKVFVDCGYSSHGGNTQHVWGAEPDPIPDHYVCQNDGCSETRPLN